MHIYFKNIPARFYPGPIWNDRALGFFKEVAQTSNKRNKMSSNMRSIHDLKSVMKMMMCEDWSRMYVDYLWFCDEVTSVKLL